MRCEELFAKIDELKDEYIKVWEDVCNIESPTQYKPGVDAVGDFFAEMAKKRGWQVEYCCQEVAGNALCITMNPEAGAPAVVLSGHMDTVHPVGSFGAPAVRLDEEKIYGPGVLDCKSGGVSSFLAMDALDRAGFRDRPVKLILQSDEENGSATSNKRTVEFMARMAKDCCAFLNAEPHPKGKLVLYRKGICKFRFDITGKACHAGICYNGVSAIAEAAKIILELEKYKDKDGITMSCGLISGGTATNTVPETCSFRVDTRFATQAQRDEILAIVHQFEEKTFHPDTKCQVTMESYRCSMELNPAKTELLDRLNCIFADAGLPQQCLTGSNGGSDAADMSGYGINAIDGFGTDGANFHKLSEQSEIATLAEAAQRLALAAVYL